MDNVTLTDIVCTMQKNFKLLEHRLEVTENLLFQSKEVLTVEEAAKFLGLSKSFVYKMTHEGTIPFYKPNGKVCYFEKNELLEWMRKNRVSTKDEVDESARALLQEMACK